MKKRQIVTVLLILFSLILIFLFLAELTAPYRRTQRELQYLDAARRAAAEWDVPVAMVMAVIRTESDFCPDAISAAGACGLMQLMPETFRHLQQDRLNEQLPDNAIFDPAVNLRYGTYYLAYLFERFDNWQVALAAYNAGEGRVTDWLADPALSQDGVLLHIPFAETHHYVTNTLSAFEAYREKYK